MSAAATAVAAFVGFTERFPTDDPTDPQGLKPRLVTSWLDYEAMYGGFVPGYMLPLSVYGYFNNGGSVAYIVRVANTVPADEPARAALPSSDRALGNPIRIESLEPGADIVVEVSAVEPDPESTPEGPNQFRLTVLEGGKRVESFTGLGFTKADTNPTKAVNGVSTKIKVDVDLAEDVDISELIDILKPGSYPLAHGAPTPVPVNGRSFVGSETARTGISGLTIADDVTMVIVPDLITAARKADGTVDLNLWKAVQTSLISHCEQQANRMAILDAPPGMGPQQIREWRNDTAMYDSAFAAMYYPWIKVDNPTPVNGDSEILIPPSGHIAGLWARTDETRGVWKAPANDTLRGCLSVERDITKTEQGLLNPIGINCIRPFGSRGIRVWGARTLTSDSEWRYINVRRLFNMIETTIMDGTQWAVFEPNDERLWGGVNRTVSAFLRTIWADGGLFGQSAEQAFYVKCDGENNPPESIDEGRLIIEVGIAPVKPAEFVIFRISQHQPGGGAEAETEE